MMQVHTTPYSEYSSVSVLHGEIDSWYEMPMRTLEMLKTKELVVLDIKCDVTTIESQFRQYIVQAELHRSQRFHLPKDRICFMCARAVVRKTLGLAATTTPQHIDIVLDQYGKPYCPSSELHFNISHSMDRVVLAFAKKAVGVDVQAHVYKMTPEEWSRIPFHKRDVAWLNQNFDCNAHDGWQTLWTLKESYYKALGCGLSKALNSCYVISRSGDIVTIFDEELLKYQNIMMISTDPLYKASVCIICS